MTRYVERSPDAMSPEQRTVYEAILAGPRGVVLAPHHILLEAPQIAGPAQEIGAVLRFGTSLAPHLSELAILVTARHWSQGYEWRVHAPLARAAGVSEEALAALADDRDVTFPSADEALVYSICREVLRTGSLTEAAFDAGAGRLGRPGLVELLSIVGFYSWLAFLLNAHGVPGDEMTKPRAVPSPWAGFAQGSFGP